MSDSTRKKMSEISKERNARPEYNVALSERARKQHASGRFGYDPNLTKKKLHLRKSRSVAMKGNTNGRGNLGRKWSEKN